MVADLAHVQGGHITYSQLLEMGIAKGTIDRWVKRGWLIRVYHGVYAVGHLPTDPVSRCKGALLACGPRSVVALDSAGAHWGMRKHWPEQPELLVVTGHRPQNITIHRTQTLTRTEIEEPEQNFRVTTPARTLIDLATRTPDDQKLEWMASNAIVRRLTTKEQIEAVTNRHPRHKGSVRLSRLLGLGPQEPFRSPWEAEWPAFAAEHDLPGYDMNVHVHGIRVDIFYPGRLVVWLDGWGAHNLKPAFERDRAEANDLLAEHGVPAVRVTHTQFHAEPKRAAGWVRKALSRATQSGAAAA